MDTTTDVQRFHTYRNEDRLIQFLIAVRDEFKYIHALLLHMVPLPNIPMDYCSVGF